MTDLDRAKRRREAERSATQLFRAWVGWQYVHSIDRERRLQCADSYSRALGDNLDWRYWRRLQVILYP